MTTPGETARLLCLGGAMLLLVRPASSDEGIAEHKSDLSEAATSALAEENWEALAAELENIPAEQHTVNSLYYLGLSLLRLDRSIAATRHLKAAFEREPENISVSRLLMRSFAGSYQARGVTAVVDAHPLDGEIRHLAGITRMNLGFASQSRQSNEYDVKKAREYFEKAKVQFEAALRVDYDTVENRRWLAFVCNRLGFHSEAIEHAGRAIEFGPVGAEAYLLLASSLTQNGRHAEAAAVYAQAREVAPAKTGYLEYERGRALFNVGLYNDAIEAFRAALVADFQMVRVRHWLGRAAFGAGNYSLALWAFAESADIDEQIVDYYWLGRCAYAVENDELAESYIRTAIDKSLARRVFKLHQTPSDWRHYLGRALWGQGKKEEAIVELTAAHNADKDNELYARWLFQCHLSQADPRAAMKVCDTLAEGGETDLALSGIDTVLEKWPNVFVTDLIAGRTPHTFVAETYRADINYRARRYRSAIVSYEELRQTQGRFAKYRAGWALARTGQFSRARQTFSDYVQNQPAERHDYGHFGLGYVEAALGNWKEAADHCQKLSRDVFIHKSQSVLLYAGLASGDASVDEYANAMSALGIYWDRRDPGIRITGLLPEGLLGKAEPRVLVGDVLLKIGDTSLGSKESVENYLKSPIPNETQQALIWRGRNRFYVDVDYGSVIRRLEALKTTEDSP